MMERKIYFIGFILFALKYLYAFISRIAIVYIGNNMDQSLLVKVSQISYYISTTLSVILILWLIRIFVAELKSGSGRSNKVMAVINPCLATVDIVVSFAVSIYMTMVISKRFPLPFPSESIGQNIFLITTINSALGLVIDVAILLMMIICYRASKKEDAVIVQV